MRAYQHFSINRSTTRILPIAGILLVPVFLMFIFSVVTEISFNSFLNALLISFARVFAAYFFSLLLAWLVVVGFMRGKAENFFVSLFDVLQSLPTFTILPIAITFLGQSELVIFFFSVLTIIWPIIFSIYSSIKKADKSWQEAVTISKISGWNYLRYYLFPVTFPGIITGSVIGLGSGWESLIATELLTQTNKGLGPFFNLFSQNNSTTLLGILVVLSIIYSIDKLLWLPLLKRSNDLLES